MPTQNLLSLLLLLMLMIRNVLTVLCSFGSLEEFEVEVQAKLLKLKFGKYFAAEAW